MVCAGRENVIELELSGSATRFIAGQKFPFEIIFLLSNSRILPIL